MMDYEGHSIELFPEREKLEERYVDVNIGMLTNSLKEKSDSFLVVHRGI
jgi:hypothetical protein